jgi:uncharacterized membrane protein
MLETSMPPLLNCPFCEREVEIVALQRDPDNSEICIVMYFHPNGEKHFTTYKPAAPNPQRGLLTSV